jgi:hypothetical protein
MRSVFSAITLPSPKRDGSAHNPTGLSAISIKVVGW